MSPRCIPVNVDRDLQASAGRRVENARQVFTSNRCGTCSFTNERGPNILSGRCKEIVGGNKLLNLVSSNDQSGGGGADFLRNATCADISDIYIRQVIGNLVSELLIGRDQHRPRCFGTSKIKAVINRMVYFHRDLSGAFDEVAVRVENNHLTQIRKFIEISSRIGNFVSAGLFQMVFANSASKITGACRSSRWASSRRASSEYFSDMYHLTTMLASTVSFTDRDLGGEVQHCRFGARQRSRGRSELCAPENRPYGGDG